MKSGRPKKAKTVREYCWILIFGDWVPAQKLLDGWEVLGYHSISDEAIKAHASALSTAATKKGGGSMIARISPRRRYFYAACILLTFLYMLVYSILDRVINGWSAS